MAPRPRTGEQKARLLALCAAVGVFGLAIWVGSTPSQLEWTSAHASAATTAAAQTGQPVAASALAAAFSSTEAVSAKSAPARCNPWEVSPVAMEAILEEMVRRGWQPPRGDLALASNQPAHGRPILPLNPDQPLWVSEPRESDPVEAGEVIDTEIAAPNASGVSDLNAEVSPPQPPPAPAISNSPELQPLPEPEVKFPAPAPAAAPTLQIQPIQPPPTGAVDVLNPADATTPSNAP